MKLDYDELRKLYRLEKNSSSLAEVEDDFFDSLREFFEQEKKDYLKSLSDLSSTKAKSFTNLKKMVAEIFNIREKKLLNRALVASRTGELETSRLALEEAEILRELLSVLNRHQMVLDQIFSVKQKTGQSDSGKSGGVSLKVLQNVPQFMGADMKEYGPFEKEKIVSVPEKIASLLVARNLAEKA